jgi:hypothetical protein
VQRLPVLTVAVAAAVEDPVLMAAAVVEVVDQIAVVMAAAGTGAA